jgi:hypothetical protein
MAQREQRCGVHKFDRSCSTYLIRKLLLLSARLPLERTLVIVGPLDSAGHEPGRWRASATSSTERASYRQNQSSSSGMKNERRIRIGIPSRRIAVAAARARAAVAAGPPAHVLGTYASRRNVPPIAIRQPVAARAFGPDQAPQNGALG